MLRTRRRGSLTTVKPVRQFSLSYHEVARQGNSVAQPKCETTREFTYSSRPAAGDVFARHMNHRIHIVETGEVERS